MSQDTMSLPQGAGATTGSSSEQNKPVASSRSETHGTSPSSVMPAAQLSSEPGSFSQGEHETSHRTSGQALVLAERETTRPNTAVILGSALAGAIVGGAIPFMLAGRSSGSQSRRDGVAFKETVTINRPAQELYDFWRDFTNLPQFMDNIKSVEKLGSKRSHWVIKAPAGTSVEFDSRVVDDVPGKLIAWESEEGATVPNRGRVEFNQTSSGATVVRTAISYDPPAGAAGRMIAKLFQREPAMQAREDLARFKELMESSGSR
jgi:uncharacterized membrane protein